MRQNRDRFLFFKNFRISLRKFRRIRGERLPAIGQIVTIMNQTENKKYKPTAENKNTDGAKSAMSVLSSIKRLHFAGIGGISMSSLALWAKRQGYFVDGSDRSESALTEMLEKNGIPVKIGQSEENVIGAQAVIYSVALHPDNPELVAAAKLSIPCFTRGQFLGFMMSFYKTRIGISGTHGKSTTTAMLSHILLAANADPTIACGAVMPELGGASRIGDEHNIVVYEACEYRDSFLSFCPTDAVITNVELDHTDYFANLDRIIDSFSKSIEGAKTVYINADNDGACRAVCGYGGKIVRISLSDKNADYHAENISYEHGCAGYTLVGKDGPLCDIKLSLIGQFNIYNSLCAAAVACEQGVAPSAVADALRTFTGVSRRFERKGEKNGVAVYDDYAHHPDEVAATLRSLPALGYRKIYLVFQPHTYTRTHDLWDKWVKIFTEAKSLGVNVILADIFAARETDTLGVSSKMLADACGGIHIESFEKIAEYLENNAESGDLILTMGAGKAYLAGDIFLSEK